MLKLILFVFIGFASTCGNAQLSATPNTENSRELNRLIRINNGISQLLNSNEEFNTLEAPNLATKKVEFAPNFPVLTGLDEAQSNNLVESWIIGYKEEYDDYILYLETLYRMHR